MKSNRINEDTKVYDLTMLDLLKNVMVKIYESSNGYSFRLVLYQNNTEIDPISHSNKKNWAYGPYKSPKEAFLEAKELYKTSKK